MARLTPQQIVNMFDTGRFKWSVLLEPDNVSSLKRALSNVFGRTIMLSEPLNGTNQSGIAIRLSTKVAHTLDHLHPHLHALTDAMNPCPMSGVVDESVPGRITKYDAFAGKCFRLTTKDGAVPNWFIVNNSNEWCLMTGEDRGVIKHKSIHLGATLWHAQNLPCVA